MNTVRTYQQAREDRLATLLEDPASWLFIARHAREIRDQHDHGTPAWSVLTRLQAVAVDLVRLADDTEQRNTA